MPEIKNYTFDHTELAEILVRKLGIHEGHWGVYIEFGFTAGNIAPIPADTKTVLPASINFVQKIGIQRFETPSSLSINAAEVNPPTQVKKKH